MSRLDLITIAIVIVCLAALGYLVYKIVNLMNPPQEETTSIQDTYTEPATDDATYTDWDDEVNSATEDGEDLDDEDLGSSVSDEAASGYESGSYSDDELDNDSDDIAEEPSSSSADEIEDEEPATRSYDNTPTTSSSGKYMVIAGSYRQKVNAENQVAKLRKLGYNESRIESFNRGSYAAVLVDRYNSYSDAKALVSKLAGDGVEAMVKEKN